MEFLIVLVLLLVLGFFLVSGLGAFLGIGLFVSEGNARKKAEANAPVILDEAFDGRRDVVFKVTGRTLPYETVVLGARARGYRLVSETSEASGALKTLVFSRRHP